MLKLRIPLPVFRNAREIVNGRNARMALRGIVANRVALIISSSFKNSAFFEQVIRLIGAQSVTVIEKSWQGEPTVDGLRGVIAELEAFQPDYIVALGGGAVIDGAKLAWLFYENATIETESLYRPLALPPLRGKAKFAAIPTTVGAGSEVSSAAVMYDESRQSKRAVVTHDFLPDLVILDPELVTEVPANVLRTTVADALSHAIEGYVSKIEHPLMATFAEKSLEIIYRHRVALLEEHWTTEMLQELQYAAMLAGWVQNHCLVGLSHAIAHQLTPFNIAHGVGNGMLMPYVIAYNCQNESVKSQYAKLAKNAGVGDVQEIIALFESLVNKDDYQVVLSQEQRNTIAENALLDPAAKVNPVNFSEDDVKEILKQCL
ncbi:TPA: iron-containing alcohol dehydrogenase [Vibrio vulnificus]|nr:iron-containing alcohol dehydrogenase [Vibrio vulnificus]HDY7670977.1 iron-containing alcohol dehydrogenase [Vibrio vulnificus]